MPHNTLLNLTRYVGASRLVARRLPLRYASQGNTLRALSKLLVMAAVVSIPAFGAEQGDVRTQLEKRALVCKQDRELATLAAVLRDKGKTKEEVAKDLSPREPNNNRWTQLMYEILDDVYGYPEIRQYSYYAYRSEICFREAERKPNPAGFRVVAPDVLACQKKYGEVLPSGIIDCIRDAVIKGANAKQ